MVTRMRLSFMFVRVLPNLFSTELTQTVFHLLLLLVTSVITIMRT